MIDSATIQRLRVPAAVSCGGLLLTHILYVQSISERPRSKSTTTALAVLNSRTELIERRPTTRIIWETLHEGDSLFGGEAVRTSSKASGKITFLKSGVSFGIEPDSLVIIEEEAGNLQLNLVNGGVFVKHDAKSTGEIQKSGQPVIKAGDKKIELSQAKSSELNLSMGTNGSANISVTKGDIQLADNNGRTQRLSEGEVKAISTNSKVEVIDAKGPRPGAAIPVSGASDLLQITWNKAPTGSMIALEIGQTRETMRSINPPVPSSLGKISTSLPTGYFFWQISAMRDGKVVGRSPVVFNQSIVLEPPRLISNANGEKVILKSDQDSAKVLLSWTKPAGSEGTTIVIAKDPQLQRVEVSQNFNSETELLTTLTVPGTYYWNITANWTGITKKITSNIGSFTITKEREVPPPVIEPSLLDKEYYKSQTDEEGLTLQWIGQQGIDGYVIKISMDLKGGQKELIKKEITTNQFRLSNIPAGSYYWSVSSRIGQSESKTPASARFRIVETAKLTIDDANLNQSSTEFISTQFKYSPKIANAPYSTAFLRYKIHPSGQPSNQWYKSADKQSVNFTVSSAGAHSLIVEAVDVKNKTVGTTGFIHLNFTEPKLLQSPQLSSGVQKLKASELGEITFKWGEISGATRYLVQITGPKTKFRKETSQASFKLSGMLPGSHQLILTAIDAHGRPGKPGAPVIIEVPEVSSIAAPTVKGLKIR